MLKQTVRHWLDIVQSTIVYQPRLFITVMMSDKSDKSSKPLADGKWRSCAVGFTIYRRKSVLTLYLAEGGVGIITAGLPLPLEQNIGFNKGFKI